MTITELVLSSEGYVEVSPEVKKSFEYKLSRLLKEEIRDHKWIMAGDKIYNSPSWEEAKNDWMANHYENFVNFLKCNFVNEKGKKSKKSYPYNFSVGYKRRQSVITGGLV